ncbi:hypothetical protein Tco_1165885 [Tanacetum coccineum]
MDDPKITMEEYIRLEEEKAHRRGKVYNWETATYVTPSCKPTVSPLNDNKFNFRLPFDESDDEDYTVIYDKNLFSYKRIFVDNLKTDSENDNEKVNMPSFPSPEPTVSYFNDLDYLKEFENEFPAIVYNDALTSKLDFLTEPSKNPQHIDEFSFEDETSLSKCDGEEQNILYFNDLFPFNIIYPNDLKSDEDNDDKKSRYQTVFGGMQYDVSLGLGYGVLNTCTDLAVKKSTNWYDHMMIKNDEEYVNCYRDDVLGSSMEVKGGRSSSVSKRAWGEVGVVENKSSMGSMLMAKGEQCLDGWVRASGGEVKGGGVDFRVTKSLLGEIPRENTGESGGEEFGVDGGAV